MKKIILTSCVAVAVTLGAYAQGTVNFLSSSTDPITYTTTNGAAAIKVPIGNPASIPGVGTITIGFYFAANGTVLGTTSTAFSTSTPNFTTAWSVSPTNTSKLAPQAGSVPSTTVLASTGVAGANVEMEVVGWAGTDTSFSAALADPSALVGWSGSAGSGGSLGWSQITGGAGNPPGTAGTMVTGAGGFAGLELTPTVPEPATIALGGLGAAALLMFRRRK